MTNDKSGCWKVGRHYHHQLPLSTNCDTVLTSFERHGGKWETFKTSGAPEPCLFPVWGESCQHFPSQTSLRPRRFSVSVQKRPGRAPALPLPVFHRPVTSRLFHLWKQLLSLPSLHFSPPSPHDPIPSVYDDLHSGARGVCLRSPAAHLSRGGGSLGKVGGGEEASPGEAGGGWRGRLWGELLMAEGWQTSCSRSGDFAGKDTGARDRRMAIGHCMYKYLVKIHYSAPITVLVLTRAVLNLFRHPISVWYQPINK